MSPTELENRYQTKITHQLLSDCYDNLVQSKDDIAQELLNLNRRLVELKQNVGRIDKAIDELLFYTTVVFRTT